MASGGDERVFDMVELKRALLQCMVCKESPCSGEGLKFKLLECHHTVCKDCLEQIINNERGLDRGALHFSCPECRHRMNVPARGADGIPNNFIAQQILDFANSCKPKHDPADGETSSSLGGVRCGGCQGVIRQVQHWCILCMYLCDRCTWRHRDDKALRHHTVFVPARSSEGGWGEAAASDDSGFCPTHNHCRLDFYCRTCNVPLCKICKELCHTPGPRHSICDISKVAQESRAELDRLLEAVTEQQKLASETFRQIRQEEECINAERSRAKKRLRAFICECHNILARREMALTGSVEHRAQQRSKCLLYSKEQVRHLLTRIGSSMEYANLIKKEHAPLSVIRAATVMKPALLEIAQARLDTDIQNGDAFLSMTEADLQFDIATFRYMVSLLGKSQVDGISE
ncbi:tripartite motif-containing protein 3-like [Acanthaster planci]|uniref:Tripartite motif-containing protein 3-like n=1 Tax=Acanthaster planci TaxID=133434 RepID=A0A8B7YGH4_ACAPL|nr:tripartite motif-containing protein 3-like [Acanthaster planci]